jgi:protein-S-isoprenylcysteine O-methyltransferase Ste14
MKKRLKINGIIIACAILLILFFPETFFRKEGVSFFSISIEVLGIVCILLGQIIRVSSRGYKAENSGNSQVLVQSGPYLIVRNPMYLGILLIGLGIVLVLFKWWMAAVFLAIFIIRYLLLIFEEEKKLLKFFPKEFPAYCHKTPRLLPSLKTLFSQEISIYLPLKSSWLKKEIGTISAVLLMTILIKSLADIQYLGAKIFLKDIALLCITVIFFAPFIIYALRQKDKK